ncbi:hypothetical protein [Nocardia gamkensis]|uniref:Uncharacterized protein n=1 Tax=Nocardia gamkensis TaxID=352869 RepID=A0A7X6LBJ0_9NOCA|nr:hypothetical protein [Nocardia gamkensis]NKY31288.1 hypothetical protein [Nocardia gamkensis]
MFERCHSAREVAEVYRRRGFIVSCAFDRVFLVASLRLGAVVMPAPLGGRVRKALLDTGKFESVPVLTHARPDREWVFLVGPTWGAGMSTPTVASLEAHGVRVLDARQRIWLPMTDHPTGWHWISEPVTATSIPSRTTVACRARDLLSPARSSRARR